jgi:hypothetical protein
MKCRLAAESNKPFSYYQGCRSLYLSLLIVEALAALNTHRMKSDSFILLEMTDGVATHANYNT